MEELIEKAIKALEESTCNEVELTDSNGIKVRIVKNPSTILNNSPQPSPKSYIPYATP